MPLLYTTQLKAAEVVKRLAREFKNPRGIFWRVSERDSTPSQVKIRAWDVTAFTEHKCQVVFTVDDQGETSFVESSVCQSAHYVAKPRNVAMNALNLEFGQRPVEPEPEAGAVAESEVLVPPQPTEMSTQPGLVAQPEVPLQPNHVVEPETSAQPDVTMPVQPDRQRQYASPMSSISPLAYGGAGQYPLLNNDLARRVEAIEQNMGRWDAIINSYLGETLEQLTAQVDTIEERTTYLQQYAVSIELNLNLLWVLRFLIDKTRIRNPENQRSADSAVAALRDSAAKLQQNLWNGTDHEKVRHEWAENCRNALSSHGFSDYYGTEKSEASQTA